MHGIAVKIPLQTLEGSGVGIEKGLSFSSPGFSIARRNDVSVPSCLPPESISPILSAEKPAKKSDAD
ncbi:uncharacterized protein EAE98_012027 [Botrytis deweyae]|uniref:Uncharacterized protein n=1 Tax=Botrytis deweyae TaxID=2478750 RepID=A0ABQ7I465_9HELO|nr:uncharacterized protein EAE98_012027 [Botrytis deweyae]KAF7910495.1 hypothetical protein EAE98_012027 [Botrytis deweyae]